MPPKGKGGKKAAVVIEGLDTTEMNNPQLQQYMMQIYEKLLKEREERSFFQLERDKLRTFWEITRNQLDEARAQIRTKDYALELAEERRVQELNEVNQKVKYLIYEQNLQLADALIKEKDALILAEKDFNDQQLELLADKKELKSMLKTMEETHQQDNKSISLLHADEKTEMRLDFEKRTEDMIDKFDKRLTNTKTQLETKHKLETGELTERKSRHIKNLTDNHAVAFNDIRNYYNNITLNNFSLITDLKANIEEMKRKEAVKDKQLKETLKDNKALQDEITKEKAQMKDLKHQLANYRKETLKIVSMKQEMNKAKLALDKLTWDYEVLNIRFENNRNEKNKIENEKMIQATDLQREMGGRLCYFEEKLKAVKGQVERREQVINEFRKEIQTARLDGDKSQHVREMTNILGNYDEIRQRRMTRRQSLFL